MQGHDLRTLLRGGADDEQVAAFLRTVWGERRDRYSEIRSLNTPGGSDVIPLRKVEMSHIGG